MSLKLLGLLGIAGMAGTLCRFAVAAAMQRLTGASYPWGTLVVNVVGCFLFGLIWSLAEDRQIITGSARFVALTGFMGAFTTFSTFAYEGQLYLKDGQWGYAALHVLGQNILGIAAVFLGISMVRGTP